RKVGVGSATISRALRDLVKLGMIRIVKARGRRWIVFPSHPHAAAFLADLGVDAEPAEAPAAVGPGPVAPTADRPDEPADHPVAPAPQDDRPADRFDRRSVDVKPGDEAHPEPAPVCEGGPELSPSGIIPRAVRRDTFRGIKDRVTLLQR